MARSKTKQTRADRVKALPWITILQALVVIERRWWALSQQERVRLVSLVRESHGRPDQLSAKQRNQLRELTRKLDLKGMVGELATLARGVQGRGRRRLRRAP